MEATLIKVTKYQVMLVCTNQHLSGLYVRLVA